MSFPAEPVFDAVLSNSLHASALIGCVVVLRRVAGPRLPAQCFHLLWLLAAIRFLTPLLPNSTWSFASHFSNRNLPLAAQPLRWRFYTIEGSSPAPEILSKTASVPSEAASARLDTAEWLTVLWLAGVLAQVALLGRAVAQARRPFEGAAELRDPHVLTLAKRCAASLRLRSVPRLFESDSVWVPTLIGLWNPRLLLPRDLANQLTDEEYRMVLRHECAHIRRGDLCSLWLFTLVRLLHWFNPFAWVALRLARIDMELACDEAVLQRTRSPELYGNTLLKLARKMRPASLYQPALGMVHVRRALHTRLARIGAYTPRSFLRSGFPALAILCAATFVFGADVRRHGVSPPGAAPHDPAAGEHPSEVVETGGIEGWTITHLTIPGSGKVADAHVTLRSPAGRSVTLTRGIESREGISLRSLEWSGTPVRVKAVLAKGENTTTLEADASLVSEDASLPKPPSQVEFEARFIEVSDATAKSIRALPSSQGNISFDAGTLRAAYSAILAGKLPETLTAATTAGDAIAQLLFGASSAVQSAPRVTTKSGQRAVIEIIREYRYPNSFKPDPQRKGNLVPGEFETRDTGTTLEVEPVLDEDHWIRFRTIPQLVELKGYVDYITRKPLWAVPVNRSQSIFERMENPVHFDPKPGRPAVPVFSSRKVSATVAVRSGQSVLFLGLPETEKKKPFQENQNGKTIAVVITAKAIDEHGNANEDSHTEPTP